jgi:hypothetical protein
VIYFTGSYSRTRAVDARSGKVLWEYDPKVIEHAGDRLRIMWDSNRGPAFYKGKLIISTVDGRLVALDAKTGKMLWETMTIDPRRSYYITGAPKVFRDKVIIGNGGTEHEAARGYVTAYDIDTGKQAWRFYIVPGNPGRRLREQGHGNGGQDLDRRMVEARRRRQRVERHHLRRRVQPGADRHRQRLAVEPEDQQPRRWRQPVPVFHRRARRRHRRVQVALPDQSRRNLGLTTPTWTSCWPT